MPTDDDDFDNFPEGEESLEASLDMHGSFLPPDESFSTDNNEYEPEYNKYNTTDHESTKDAIKECLQPFPFNYQTYEAYLKSPLRSPARQEPPSQWDEDDSQPQFYTRPSPSRYARQSPFAGPSPSRYPGPSPSYFHYPSPSLYDLPTPPRASPSRYPGPSPSRYAVSPDLHYLLGDLSITSPSHTTTKSQQEAQVHFLRSFRMFTQVLGCKKFAWCSSVFSAGKCSETSYSEGACSPRRGIYSIGGTK